MKWFKAVVCLAVLAVSPVVLATRAMGQQPVYHPGQTLTIDVTFDGKDADQVSRAIMVFNAKPYATPKDEPGFSIQISSGSSKKVGANKFEIAFTIPETQATGDYELSEIRATFLPDNNVTLTYESPTDFPSKTVRVENSKTLEKPKIKDVQVQ